MHIRLLLSVALVFTTTTHAVKDTKLTHDVDLIGAMEGVAKSCVNYALRETGGALAGYQAVHGDESRERKNAWRNITYTRYFEACVAEVAHEMAETASFDLDKGKADLQKLSPLYAITDPPTHIDVSVTLVSPNTIRYGETTMLLRDFLEKIWSEQWKDIVVNNNDSVSGTWCLLHLGYISGARIHIRDSDGAWSKVILNAGTGEKGTALAINQCLSGDLVEGSSQP